MLKLLKWIIKMSTSCTIKTFITLFSVITSLSALSAEDQKLQIHGFIAQGVIDANGSNYINDQEKVSLELTEIGFNASYQLADEIRLAGQAVYLNGGNRFHEGGRLDYFLLEWDAFHNDSWRTRFYFGRVKNNHWLYSSTRDIPFARPSIIVPQSVYFDSFRDIAMGGDGAAMKVTYSDDAFGELDFTFSRGKSSISDDQAKIVLGDLAQGSIEHDLDTQASIYWQPAYSQWRFGLSALDSTFRYKRDDTDNFFDSEFTFQFYTANVQYEGEHWQLSAEIFQQRFVTDGFYTQKFLRDDTGQGYYIQASYKLSNNLSLMARHERFYLNKDDKNGSKLEQNSRGSIPSYFAFHNDMVIGLSYDVLSNFRINAEYHWMQGAGRLAPIVQPNPIANGNKNWQVWALQMMYWF